jgi:uracil-DNA glycosylase family 4
MTGFFTKRETESQARPNGKILSCVSCGKYKGSNTPKMKPYGEFGKGILIIGRNPERRDDQMGEPFQGQFGDSLKLALKDLSIDLFKDCLCTFACFCRGKNDEQPTKYEVDCCRKDLFKVIKEYKPKVIILLGSSAAYSIIGHRWKHDFGSTEKAKPISRWRGWTIPDQEFKCWICPTFSPQEVHNDKKEVVSLIWKQDLKRAIQCLGRKFPEYKEPKIEVLDESDLSKLDEIEDGTIAFDYETSGLKPHREGHRIVCCSIAVSRNKVYVFMMPKRKKYQEPFLRLLANSDVKKMGHNCKYEDNWSNVILKQDIKGWYWDSMLAAHVLDNRPGITGLKFQTYVQFGIIDYSSEIEPYLQAKDGTANEFNRILKLVETTEGKQKLLKYNALDSIYEYRLAELQQKIINIKE